MDADGDRPTVGTQNVLRAVQTLLPAVPSASYTFNYPAALDGNTTVISSAGYEYSSTTIQE